MAAAIVDLTNLTGWGLVALQELRIGLIERVRQNLCDLIVRRLRQVFQRRGQREEFAQRIPAEVALLLELLHMFRRGPSRTGLEQAAAVQKRHNREHLGAGSYFENREQIREVV